MVRIVFTADNHLNRYYAKMRPDQLAQRRARIREAWAQTVDFAIREKAHLYLHGGDLFDSPNPHPTELTFVARHFQRLRDAGTETLAIGGNHDVPKVRGEGATPLRIYHEVGVAHVFTKTIEVDWQLYNFDGTTVAVGGLAPDPRLGKDDDPLADVIINAPQADLVLLMMHCAVEATTFYEANEPLLSLASISTLRGVDYLLIGHLHQKENLKVGDVTVLFPGATERMNFGEMHDPTFLYLTIGGKRRKRLDIQRVPIAPQPMKRIVIRTTDLPDDDPTSAIFDFVRQHSHPDQMLQCRLEGPMRREMYHGLRFSDVWQLGNELNFFFDLDRAALSVQDDTLNVTGAPGVRVSPRSEIEVVAAALAAEADDAEGRLVEEAKELVLERYEEA